MQIKIFNIPVGAEESMVDEMNHFLRANKIIDIKKDLALMDGNSCWTFCVTYMLSNKPAESETARHGGNKVDYKDVLDAESFKRFSILRKFRKKIAENEAIPAYAVFTDAELAEMAKMAELTMDGMHNIPGIGKKKLEKYGNVFMLNAYTEENETSGIPDGADSQP